LDVVEHDENGAASGDRLAELSAGVFAGQRDLQHLGQRAAEPRRRARLREVGEPGAAEERPTVHFDEPTREARLTDPPWPDDRDELRAVFDESPELLELSRSPDERRRKGSARRALGHRRRGYAEPKLRAWHLELRERASRCSSRPSPPSSSGRGGEMRASR